MWTSIPPGKRYFPDASIVLAASPRLEADLLDRAALDADVGLVGLGGRDDRAVAQQEIHASAQGSG